MKQTAVEFLAWKFATTDIEEFKDNFNEIIGQAKQMEKEQIIDAYLEPIGMKHNEKWVNMFTEKAEQYYNETYGKDE